MRIAIVTTGRFHVLDLARELSALGHDVAFYSYVPRSRAIKFGLPAECHRALLPWVWPLAFLGRSRFGRDKAAVDALMQRTVDNLAARFVAPCDFFIGMSGLCVRSAQAARRKYGARIILERGSRHILSQKEILEKIPGMAKPVVPEFNIRRELWGYDFADLIAIPSRHVERSFLEKSVVVEKLLRNPYGVDLAMFSPTPKPKNRIPTLVFAGTWSLRKGCDVLGEAIAGREWRLIHAGATGDAPSPKTPNFESRGFVPQSGLAKVYGEADLFVHPSREEGLSVVQAQALACGLPLVCTDRTGGEDLQELLDDPSSVTVVPSDDVRALQSGIERGLKIARQQEESRDILRESRCRLSWTAYGRRYDQELAAFCVK